MLLILELLSFPHSAIYMIAAMPTYMTSTAVSTSILPMVEENIVS